MRLQHVALRRRWLAAERFGRAWADSFPLRRAPRPSDAVWQLWGALQHGERCELLSGRCACIDPEYVGAWIAAAAERLAERLDDYLNEGYAMPDEEEELRQALRRCRQIRACVFCDEDVDTTNAVCINRDGELAHGGCLRDELEAAEGK